MFPAMRTKSAKAIAKIIIASASPPMNRAWLGTSSAKIPSRVRTVVLNAKQDRGGLATGRGDHRARQVRLSCTCAKNMRHSPRASAMTEADLLDLVRSMPRCEQSSHFGTMDFRVRNKIFASHPKPAVLNLKLTPEQQAMLCDTEPTMFAPLPNKWGEKGWTTAAILALDKLTARSALEMAWGNVAPKSLRKG
jgi:hypothetical protein